MKRKKYNHKKNYDSELPRNGLHPVITSILSDKGPQAWSSFNNAMGDGAVGEAGGLGEDVELTEASDVLTKNIRNTFSSVVSSHTVILMNNLVKGQPVTAQAIANAIVNLDQTDFLNLINPKVIDRSKYITKILRPSTSALLDYSNPFGAKNLANRSQGLLEHHVYGVHPTAKGDATELTNITIGVTIQTHADIHNKAFAAFGNYLMQDQSVQKLFADCVKASSKLNRKKLAAERTSATTAGQPTVNKTCPTCNQPITPAVDADIMQDKIRNLKAYFIREIWKKEQLIDKARIIYQDALQQGLREVAVDHPEFLTDPLKKYPDTLIRIPDARNPGKYIEAYLIIGTIDKDQVNTAYRYVKGNILVEYPKSLEKDFIACVSKEPGFLDMNNYNEFDNYMKHGIIPQRDDGGDIQEYLSEAKQDEYEKLSPADFKKYFEHNLNNRVIVINGSNSKESNTFTNPVLSQLINTYFDGDTIDALYSTEDNKHVYLDNAQKVKKLWKAPLGTQTNRIKQRIIAEFVRWLLNYSGYSKYAIMIKPDAIGFDEEDNLYKLNVRKFILKDINTGDEFEVASDFKKNELNIEDIFSQIIDDNKMIKTNFKDTHFLDAAGNIVPGIRFSYDNQKQIVDIVSTTSCKTHDIAKVIVSRPNYYNKSIGLMLDKNEVNNIDTVVINTSSLNKGAFTYLKCKNIIFDDIYTQAYMPDECFRSLDCPTVDIPTTVVSLGEKCFAYSKMTSIIIPETCKKLEKGCFSGCDNLIVKFEIPKSKLPKTRDKWGSEPYQGYLLPWGKTEVKGVEWGVTGDYFESLREAVSKIEDKVQNTCKVIFEDPNYMIYEFSDIQELKPLLVNAIENDGEDAEKAINHLLTNFYSSDDSSRYFIENKNDIKKSMVADKDLEHFRWLRKYTYQTLDKNSWDISIGDKRNIYDIDPELFKTLLFNMRNTSFDTLFDILKYFNIDSKSKEDDYNIDWRMGLSEIIFHLRKNDLIYMILRAFETDDLETAVSIAGVKDITLDKYKEDIKNILSSSEGAKILKDSSITPEDVVDALDGSDTNGLSNFLDRAMKETLAVQIKDVIKKVLKDQYAKYDLFLDFEKDSINFDIRKAYLDTLGIFDLKLTPDNVLDDLENYVIAELRNNAPTQAQMKTAIEDITLDSKIFLTNLQDILKYY